MAETHVISGLVAKRSELLGIILSHQTIIKQLSSMIVHIDSTIKLFDPEYDLRTVKVKIKRTPNPWFEHGEVGRMILDILRKSSQPLSTRQLGEAMIASKDLIVENAKAWDAVLKPVLCAAQRLERKQVIKAVGRVNQSLSGAILWQLAD